MQKETVNGIKKQRIADDKPNYPVQKNSRNNSWHYFSVCKDVRKKSKDSARYFFTNELITE